MLHSTEGSAPELNADNQARYHDMQDWKIDHAEVEDVPAYDKRRSAGIWACIATLTVALAVVVVYGYAVLKQEDTQIAQVSGMMKTLPAISQNVASFERRYLDLKAGEQNLLSQVQGVDAKSRVAIGQNRQQTDTLVAQMQRSLIKGLKERTVALQDQVSQMASERGSEQLRLAQVEEQLTQARYELEAARKDYTRQLAAVREQQSENHSEIASINNSLSTRQVTFEIQRYQDAAIAPGISFHLTRTDVRHQRFDGWIESSPGNQKVNVQSQGAGKPVIFYPSEQGKAFVMIVTRVDQKGASGYLLTPSGDRTEQPALISVTDNQHVPAAVPSAPPHLELNGHQKGSVACSQIVLGCETPSASAN